MAHQNPPKPKAREDSCTVRRSLRDLRPIMPPAKGRERRERLPFTPYRTRGLHTVFCWSHGLRQQPAPDQAPIRPRQGDAHVTAAGFRLARIFLYPNCTEPGCHTGFGLHSWWVFDHIPPPFLRLLTCSPTLLPSRPRATGNGQTGQSFPR